MTRQIYVNLPVADLPKSIEFFTQLGFTFNPQFTDENATCMVINDNAFVMLLAKEYFQTFTPRPVSDAGSATEVLIAVSADSREHVDELASAALAAGGENVREPQDHGFMYQRSISDLDGHIWEIAWMDPSALQ